MNILIANDHAGYSYKEKIKKYLQQKKINVIDIGCDSENSVDYPDFAHKLAQQFIKEEEESLGILICGTGNGVSMVANKYQKIRAALCWNKEVAILAKQHNDANVLSLPARYLDEKTVIEIVDIFIREKIEEERHKRRVSKI